MRETKIKRKFLSEFLLTIEMENGNLFEKFEVVMGEFVDILKLPQKFKKIHFYFTPLFKKFF